MEPVLVVVRDPRPGGHREDRLAALHVHPEELDGAGADVAGASVGQVAGHLRVRIGLAKSYFKSVNVDPCITALHTAGSW